MSAQQLALIARLSDTLKKRILLGYKADLCCLAIKKAVSSRDDCTTINGFLFVHGRLVLPVDSALRLELISRTDSKMGHPGFLKLLRDLRCTFFWPHMCDKIKIYVQQCPTCQHAKNLSLRQPEHCKPEASNLKHVVQPPAGRTNNLNPNSACVHPNRISKGEERLGHLEDQMRLLLGTLMPPGLITDLQNRPNTFPVPRKTPQAIPPAGSFRYSIDWGLQPLVSKEVQQLLLRSWPHGNLFRSNHAIILPRRHGSPSPSLLYNSNATAVPSSSAPVSTPCFHDTNPKHLPSLPSD
ncbi:hypothetical protein PTTG_27480 [Puccinia triticina 1-1 BBBD Race 1]|uniref:Integrase_H2C2 domain-containing protein n=1 Tax=Puccinia triticina (isolate 1-1 / race 1 (BBBD)) TaxID=630390 RepID=A0A180GJS4_PUCT1|nr:hypothetical protein PTTG_27480 [Puccinia triticina 1-1 BBBD Race 1]